MIGTDPQTLADMMARVSVATKDDGIERDEDGNVNILAPVARAGAAATTLVNPERSELLAGLCKNCHGVFTVGVQIQVPPPHSEAAPILVCADCLVRLFNSGQTLKIDWI